MIKKNITRQIRHAVKTFAPSRALQSRFHAKIYKNFANSAGFVYFGYVNQRDDDHRLIRGFTVSTSHKDSHYCVGSYEGYDIMLVERTDIIKRKKHNSYLHNWIIATFDLHNSNDLPHFFVGLNSANKQSYAQFFASNTNLTPISFGMFSAYNPHFKESYSVYTTTANMITIERLLTLDVTKGIVKNFQNTAIEVRDGVLYLYVEHQRPTISLLNRLIRNGVWLSNRPLPSPNLQIINPSYKIEAQAEALASVSVFFCYDLETFQCTYDMFVKNTITS